MSVIINGKEFFLRLEAFVLGAIWAALGGLGGAASVAAVHLQEGKPIDWPEVQKVAVAGIALALIGYWRERKAVLKLPAGVQEILDQAARYDATNAAPASFTPASPGPKAGQKDKP